MGFPQDLDLNEEDDALADQINDEMVAEAEARRQQETQAAATDQQQPDTKDDESETSD